MYLEKSLNKSNMPHNLTPTYPSLLIYIHAKPFPTGFHLLGGGQWVIITEFTSSNALMVLHLAKQFNLAGVCVWACGCVGVVSANKYSGLGILLLVIIDSV